MDRAEIKSKIIDYLKTQISLADGNPSNSPQIQMGFLGELFKEETKALTPWQQDSIIHVAREIVNEFINIGAIYPGRRGQVNSSDFYPWLTITDYGKKVFTQENWLPYDPEGYLDELKKKVPEIDDITYTYIGESVAAFNRKHLLSATVMLGVASENLMLLLIEAYLGWLKNPRKTSLKRRVADRGIYIQYKEFKKEFSIDIKSFSKMLQGDWETYLDGIFNFVRLNRNSAGHPTGKKLGAKVVYANLQIFADYARYIFDLANYLQNKE